MHIRTRTNRERFELMLKRKKRQIAKRLNVPVWHDEVTKELNSPHWRSGLTLIQALRYNCGLWY